MNTQTQTDNIMLEMRDNNTKAAMKAAKKAAKKAVKKALKKAAKKADNPIVASTTPPNKNFEIAYALLKLSNSVTNDDGYAWPRGEIYSNAADKISKLDYPVTSGCELAFGPKKIYGIGKGVARLIDEYLNTGTMTQSENTVIDGYSSEQDGGNGSELVRDMGWAAPSKVKKNGW